MEIDHEARAKAHPLLYVITAAVAINLIATAWLAVNLLQRPNIVAESGERLPEILGRSTRSKIYDDFRSLYNVGQYADVFEWLDDYATEHMDKDSTINVIEKLHENFGSLGDGVFSHHNFKGTESGKDWFILFYRTKMSGGSMDFSVGTVEFDVFYDGENYGVTGIRLKADQ